MKSLAILKTENYSSSLDWEKMVCEFERVFKLSKSEKKRFYNSTTAKIIATIPFAAECKNAQRIAIAHLSLYIVEIRGFHEYCNHTHGDDSSIYNRLEPLNTFDGDGIQEVIRHGMDMLALIMIEGYKASMNKDRFLNTYNPFNSGAWNYEETKSNILHRLNVIECPSLDILFDFNNPQIKNSWC